MGLAIFSWLVVALKILKTDLKFNVAISELFSVASLLGGLLFLPFSRRKSADSLMRAHRTTRRVKRQILLEEFLSKFGLLKKDLLLAGVHSKYDDSSLYHKRIFKLKEKKGEERGVLIISFDVFGQLRGKYDIEKIAQDYHLVLEPSWSGYCTPEILQFLHFDNSKVIVQAAEKLDFDFLARLGGSLVPVDIGSSDWVDDNVFNNLNLEKEYDCIMVALWADYKRHHVLFRAIRQIADPKYKACLVGVPWSGRTRQDIEEIIGYYGIRDNIEIFERILPSEVNILLNKSKVNVLLSLKEGANRSIFEGFFANVPGIVLRENRGVNKNYITDSTGRLIHQGELKNTLIWFRDRYVDFHPREWALQNISCRVSTAKLEEKLRLIARQFDEPWSAPIAVKVNRPEFEYYDDNTGLTKFELESYSLARAAAGEKGFITG